MANPVSPAEVKQAPAQNPVGFGGSQRKPVVKKAPSACSQKNTGQMDGECMRLRAACEDPSIAPSVKYQVDGLQAKQASSICPSSDTESRVAARTRWLNDQHFF